MGQRMSFQTALEDLNAMILATDPSEPSAVARLGLQVEEVLRTMQPSSTETELLGQVLSILQDTGKLETATVLHVAAAAIAELSQQADNEDTANCPTLKSAARRLQEMLRSLDAEGNTEKNRADSATSNAPGGEERNAEWASATVEVDAQLLAEFTAESYDRIALAEGATLLLEKNPHDAEAINTVLRAFHTIKGASGLLGFMQIQQLAHHAESLLIRGRDGEIEMVGGHIDLALQSCDALKFMVDSLENQPPGRMPTLPADYHGLLAAFSEHEQHGTTVRTADADTTSRSEDAADGSKTVAEAQPVSATAGDFLSGTNSDELTEESSAGARPQLSGSASPAAEASVRVNTERLDNLVNLVGELVIAQAIVAQDCRTSDSGTSRLARSVGAAGKITRQLQDLAMSLRMVPLKGTFQKMTRLVRDLAHKSVKAVHFQVAGEDTEIDRNMVEVLCDPLAHMIRNAVDHGIEPTADRVACGKSATGTLHLRAYHAAGNVVIELEDDGKGLNHERIVQQAVQRGLVDPENHLSADEAQYLIFHPGLSTAENVTEISGRGVGLDVVKRNVESLRGRIEVSTSPGAGTKFTLRLPLTTAIIDAMSVRVGGQQYLVPTVAIERSFRPEPGAVSSIAGRGEMVLLHGQVLPLFRLHRLFNVSDAQQNPQQALVIVIEGGGKRCAVLVDELLGQQQAVMKSLGDSLFNIPGVAGGAILSDGRVGLILDAAGLVQLGHGGWEGDRPSAGSGLESQRA